MRRTLVPAMALLLVAVSCSSGDEDSGSAVETATGFLQAYGAFDMDTAATYLAADADLSQLEGGQSDWRLGNRWLKAQGFKLLLGECEQQGEASPTRVRCTFDYHAIRSNDLGRGPFGGSSFDLTVAGDEILRVALHWEFVSNGFSSQMWKPFAEWIAQSYPDDAPVMYEGDAFFVERLSEESIRLWELRSREYAEAMNQS